MNVDMGGQEFVNVLGLVGREVVGDHMNFLTLGLVGHDVGEKRHELSRGVPRGGLTQHLAGFCVEGSVQRERAVAEILKANRKRDSVAGGINAIAQSKSR